MDSPTPTGARLAILVVDDEPTIRKVIATALEAEGHEVRLAGTVAGAVEEVERGFFDLALVDLRLGTQSGLDLLLQIRGRSPSTRLVVVTAYAAVETAVEAMRRGAFDYLPKPFTTGQLNAVVSRVAEVRALERRVRALRDAGGGTSGIELESANPQMRRCVELARQVAGSDATVLLRGESGTGKGVLAEAIHGWSGRREAPFASVSCPSLSAELLESELFGHVRGAFTGAVRDHAGRVEAADGGTLFLDEIGDLPVSLQPKLLRFLQERRFERVGDARTRRADVRVVAATNVDLEAAVRAGRFREDLFYRLNVIQVAVPPLRERAEDVVPLALHLLATLRSGQRPEGFTAEAQAAMRAYGWPGNVRELRNAVERCAILCRGEQVDVQDLPPPISPARAADGAEVGELVSIEKLEEAHIRRVLARTSSLEDAARILDVDVATLWRKRRKFGI